MSNVEARAAAAKRLLEDPILVEALGNIRGAAIKAWESTGIDKQQDREVAWLTVKVVNRIEAELENIITDGMIAAKRVQHPVR